MSSVKEGDDVWMEGIIISGTGVVSIGGHSSSFLRRLLTCPIYCRDLLPIPPSPGDVPSCAEGGVLGVLPGVIGCIQVRIKEDHGKGDLI